MALSSQHQMRLSDKKVLSFFLGDDEDSTREMYIVPSRWTVTSMVIEVLCCSLCFTGLRSTSSPF